MDYHNPYGLLNASADYPADTNENSSLYTVEYILKKDDPNLSECFSLVKYYALCKISNGLYNQLPFHAGNNDDYVSHDQLTAMMVISKKYNMGMHEVIWGEIRQQNDKYNNIEPGKGWILHPRDTMFYGMLAGSKLWYLTFPLLFIIMLISQFGRETSGKCLNWVRCQGMGWNWTLKILGWFMPYKDWSSVFAVYFPDPNHPINIAFQE
jgi:hypothetical protein